LFAGVCAPYGPLGVVCTQLTDWGRVYYVNLLSILPAILLGLVFQARTAAVAKPAGHGMAGHGMAGHGMAGHGMAWHGPPQLHTLRFRSNRDFSSGVFAAHALRVAKIMRASHPLCGSARPARSGHSCVLWPVGPFEWAHK
jgi:hypothetical protein